MQIQFCGAARSVTGTQHLLIINGKRLLLDCGLYQGRRDESYQRNQQFLFDPASVDAMILSHAHIDHSGNIPNLVKSGFDGNIFCTGPTMSLCNVMLQDSALIQERDAQFLNKRLVKKGEMPRQPLYTITDAQRCMNNFVSINYNRPFDPVPGVRATLLNAGHILGSAMLKLDITEDGRTIKIGFTGDLGRVNLPIIEDPDQITEVDYLISECTYGNRLHDPIEEIQEKLMTTIEHAVKENGKVIIPAFSVERTQEIIYHLNLLYEKKKVPAMPIFVDSPMAVNVTEVFKVYPNYYDEEAKKLLDGGDNPFSFDNLNYIRKLDESKNLNYYNKPCIIISASGMCEAGRILHHLANNIENPATTILVVGYMAENTLGRKIIDGAEKVRILGEEYAVRARVVKINSFSGHADQKDLLKFLQKVGRSTQIYLVHGEDSQLLPFAELLRSDGFESVLAPKMGEVFNV